VPITEAAETDPHRPTSRHPRRFSRRGSGFGVADSGVGAAAWTVRSDRMGARLIDFSCIGVAPDSAIPSQIGEWRTELSGTQTLVEHGSGATRSVDAVERRSVHERRHRRE
jgi:hypothetical protein